MDRLSTGARWKLVYDATPPLRFVFAGPRHGSAIAGYVIFSSDAAGRCTPSSRQAALERHLNFDCLPWVEQQAGVDYGIKRPRSTSPSPAGRSYRRAMYCMPHS
jgi:hypothetical protein